ncbi:MAG: hypothetical protein R2725_08885 [Solirubrobacterales bacterium]
MTEQPAPLASWKPPVIVATTAVSIVAGFYLGGPGLGMAVGALAAAAIVAMAVRQAPRPPIVPAPLRDLRRHVLVVTTQSLEDPHAVSQIARLCGPPEAGSPEHEIRVLVPAPRGVLDRWSCDRRKSVTLAQRYCLLSLASLAKAGLGGDARIGDEDVVLAVEDELRTFPATEVILVTSQADPQRHADEIAAELRARLRTDFLHLPASTSHPAPCKRKGDASVDPRVERSDGNG